MKESESLKPPVFLGKRKGRHRYLTWLSLSLSSFLALMMLITYESRWVYPEIQGYFSQTGNLTGQQLATRSRSYVQRAQEKLLVASMPADISYIRHHLELAYGLLDVDIYKQHYACTTPSLALVDELTDLIEQQHIAPLDAAHSLFIVVECLTDIEMSQLDRRGEAINIFATSTRRHSQMLTYSSMVIFVMGLLFWGMHERQLRRTERATNETLAWMKRAMRDPLTGIGNRSALQQDVLARAGEPLGLILVDIDFFKQYNDSLGHPEGDQLLRRLASLLEEQLGEGAKLYRLGGDEFAALISCPDDQTLFNACDQLIATLRRSGFKHPAHPGNQHVTLSVGAVRFVAMEVTFAHAYDAADKALYRVKIAGRDGFEVAL